MNDRITIPALNELNSHEARRNRVPNPRYHPEIEANGSFHAKLPAADLDPLRSSPTLSARATRNHVSSSTVSALLPFNLANGLDSNAVSRFLESLSRAEEGGGGGGPRLEKGNESNEEELKGDRVDSKPRRLARLVRYFNGSSNLRYFVGRDRRWRATRVFIMRC